MQKGFKTLVAEANEQIVTHSVSDGLNLLNHPTVQFVDIRDQPELKRDGHIPGAVHVSRGMLEFVVDPESPYHNPVLRRILNFCCTALVAVALL